MRRLVAGQCEFTGMDAPLGFGDASVIDLDLIGRPAKTIRVDALDWPRI